MLGSSPQESKTYLITDCGSILGYGSNHCITISLNIQYHIAHFKGSLFIRPPEGHIHFFMFAITY